MMTKRATVAFSYLTSEGSSLQRSDGGYVLKTSMLEKVPEFPIFFA